MSEREPHPHDDGAPLGPHLASAWPASEPPVDFADRLLARQAAPPRWRRPLAVLAPLTLLAAGTLVWLGTGSVSGQASPHARASLAIGRRATAVAEAGAALSFHVAGSRGGGDALVEQRQGNVFYRVERGGAFVVKTPAAEILVKGTCFRLEVTPMNIKQSLIGAALGATTASAVTVTVYEGRVEMRSAQGAVEVGPGETVRAGGEAAPTTAPAQPTSNLEARERAQRQEIARLQARVAELEQPGRTGMFEDVAIRHGSPGARPPVGEPTRPKKFLDFTREEWASMAAQCELRLQLPPIALGGDAALLDGREARTLGYSEDDRRRYNEVLTATSDEHRQALAAIYKDITGDAGERLTIAALDAEIRAKSLPGEFAVARKRYAEERAGLAPAPAKASPMDRFVRLQGSAWEDFEAKLAAVIGAEKARATRERPAVARMKIAGCE